MGRIHTSENVFCRLFVITAVSAIPGIIAGQSFDFLSTVSVNEANSWHDPGPGEETARAVGAGILAAQASGAGKLAAQAEGSGRATAAVAGAGHKAAKASGIGAHTAESQGQGRASAALVGAGKAAAEAQGTGRVTAAAEGKGHKAAKAAGIGAHTAESQGQGRATAASVGAGKSAAAAQGAGKETAAAEGKGHKAAKASGIGAHTAESHGRGRSTAAWFGAGKATAAAQGAGKEAAATSGAGHKVAKAHNIGAHEAHVEGAGIATAGEQHSGQLAAHNNGTGQLSAHDTGVGKVAAKASGEGNRIALSSHSGIAEAKVEAIGKAPRAGPHQCKLPRNSTADPGFPDNFAGWYDVQDCGLCNDYCRWVGVNGSGGDPSISRDSARGAFWSCRLAGSDSDNTPADMFASWANPKCSGEAAVAPCRAPIYQGQQNDTGFTDDYQGWYDVQGCGTCNDYCRWVGSIGTGGDPTKRLATGRAWWSCALAGTDTMHTPLGTYGRWDLPKCTGKSAPAPVILSSIAHNVGKDAVVVQGVVKEM